MHHNVAMEPHVDFVQTPYFQEVVDRAILYLQAGVPVHLQGPSGTGKTTCAMHLATRLKRPVVVMFGNDQFTPAELIGRHFGVRRKLVIDQYIHSVERRDEEVTADWVDGRLLTACREGYTLVYDEFSRSRPEANNALLSVLEERLLELPTTVRGEKYVRVHPDFRIICTSNPDEYAGVHQRPDALLDRMITLDLGAVDEESELAIVQAKTGIDEADAVAIVKSIRRFRAENPSHAGHSIRASLLIASILKEADLQAEPGTPFFDRLCQDALGRGTAKPEVVSNGTPARRRKS